MSGSLSVADAMAKAAEMANALAGHRVCRRTMKTLFFSKAHRECRESLVFLAKAALTGAAAMNGPRRRRRRRLLGIENGVVHIWFNKSDPLSKRGSLFSPFPFSALRPLGVRRGAAR